MPVFFQQQINETTRLGIWKIEETEEFFRGNVPVHRDVTHPHKRLQHLAGRFLLQFLYPDFPYELIEIADTNKPFLPAEQYHFSISHCGDYAAAIVSRSSRVGVDVEIPEVKVLKILHKFLTDKEQEIFNAQRSMFNSQIEETTNHQPPTSNLQLPTLAWSSKEAVFKWYGDGNVDFKEHILLLENYQAKNTIQCRFIKTGSLLYIHYRVFDSLVLTWVVN